MARWIMDNPAWVRGQHVVDFGAGSGVAGIAAACCDAASVTAVDIDADARIVCELNAALNGVTLAVASELIPGASALWLAADVAYEESGLAALVHHIESGGKAVIAESRLRDLHQRFPQLSLQASYRIRTFPDLDESEQFDDVHIYTTAFEIKSS